MLNIKKKFAGSVAKNPNAGDTNIFLGNILIEVVAENYKQLLHERIFLGDDRPLDPPIRANERVMSGLFGNAITAISERSRTEVRIDRESYIQDPEDADDEMSTISTHGRIDYLAWYARRTFAIELKMSNMNCESCNVSDRTKTKWKAVVKQAGNAQSWLRKSQGLDNERYPNPLSLALMVVVGRRAVGKKSDALDENMASQKTNFLDALQKLSPSPQFIASYEFPKELRRQAVRKKGSPKDEEIYIPFIAFIARAAVNSVQ